MAKPTIDDQTDKELDEIFKKYFQIDMSKFKDHRTSNAKAKAALLAREARQIRAVLEQPRTFHMDADSSRDYKQGFKDALEQWEAIIDAELEQLCASKQTKGEQ